MVTTSTASTMEVPPHLSIVLLTLATIIATSLPGVSTQESLSCEQLCFWRGRQEPPSNCVCPEDDSPLPDLPELQQAFKKAAPSNKIFRWGRKRSIDEGATGAGDQAYAPQEVQRRIFRWGKRAAPVQNKIFRWGKRGNDMGMLYARSPLYGDVSPTDVLRLEQAIRQGRLDYYDVLAGPDVPVGKRRNMNMQNKIFKWGR